MPELLIQVKEFIQKQAMPAPGAPVLVALSGGADSTALVLILLELGYEVVAAHCNFGLRAESDGDEGFVVHLADQKGFRLHVRRFEGADFISESGESTQQIARRLRYAFFEELMPANGIAHCAMAHHADDETETLIQSFFRGNGPVILRGIPPQRGPYFRPLLGIPKADLLEFLRERGQPWRHDRSNDADDYRRNLVRNQLMPVLGKLNPGFQARFQGQAIRHAAQWDLLQALFLPLAGKVEEEEGGSTSISIDTFSRHLDLRHFPVFLDWWLLQKGCSGTEINEIQRLIEAQVGATYKGVVVDALRDRDRLVFRRPVPLLSPFEIAFEEGDLSGHGVEFAGWAFSFSKVQCPQAFNDKSETETHWLDWNSLAFPVKLRRWKAGDRFNPFGMSGSRKISDILIDQKRDQFSKADAWVLEDRLGIALLGGYRIAQRVAAVPGAVCLRVCVSHSM